MDLNITRRDRMTEAYRKLLEKNGQTRAQPPSRPSGTFAHFRDDADRQAHLAQVAEAKEKFNIPF